MFLFVVPRKVSLRLKRLQRDFIQGGGALKRKSHLVNWTIVYSNNKNGALGIKNLSLLNKAPMVNEVGNSP